MRRNPSILSLLLAIALLLTACGLLGTGNVFELAVGDCFDDSAGEEEISDVPVVDCAEPHDNEVFLVFDVADGDFPGETALLQQAEDECLPAFEEYVGRDFASSRLDIFPITPTAGSWSGGDRKIICSLYDLNLAKIVDVVAALHEDGRRLAIVTSKPIESARRVVPALGIAELFVHLEAPPQAAPEHKTATMARAVAALDLDPRDTAMVGDRHHDVEAAAAHGIGTVGVTWATHADHDELADAGAAAVVAEPHRLGLTLGVVP